MTQERKRLGLSVPWILYQKLRKKAEYQGKTLNAMCLEIFWEYFDAKQNPVSESDTEAEGKNT